MKRVKIDVTAADIKKSKKLGYPPSKNCPIALAAQRAFKDADVTCGTSEVGNVIKGTRFLLPKKAINFTVRFDDELPVKPFSFTASVPVSI